MNKKSNEESDRIITEISTYHYWEHGVNSATEPFSTSTPLVHLNEPNVFFETEIEKYVQYQVANFKEKNDYYFE